MWGIAGSGEEESSGSFRLFDCPVSARAPGDRSGDRRTLGCARAPARTPRIDMQSRICMRTRQYGVFVGYLRACRTVGPAPQQQQLDGPLRVGALRCDISPPSLWPLPACLPACLPWPMRGSDRRFPDDGTVVRAPSTARKSAYVMLRGKRRTSGVVPASRARPQAHGMGATALCRHAARRRAVSSTASSKRAA